jgi:hypothetical protein
MERVAEVAVRLEFARGASVSFGDPLELSLDCSVCRRCRRTVVFREGRADASRPAIRPPLSTLISDAQPAHTRRTNRHITREMPSTELPRSLPGRACERHS